MLLKYLELYFPNRLKKLILWIFEILTTFLLCSRSFLPALFWSIIEIHLLKRAYLAKCFDKILKYFLIFFQILVKYLWIFEILTTFLLCSRSFLPAGSYCRSGNLFSGNLIYENHRQDLWSAEFTKTIIIWKDTDTHTHKDTDTQRNKRNLIYENHRQDLWSAEFSKTIIIWKDRDTDTQRHRDTHRKIHNLIYESHRQDLWSAEFTTTVIIWI